jgi:hypothetical protein
VLGRCRRWALGHPQASEAEAADDGGLAMTGAWALVGDQKQP